MKADYDLIAEDWANLRKALPPKDSLLFEYFIKNLSQKSEVLDLGCGTGVPVAKWLSDNGFRITGVDRSEKLLEKARKNLPTTDFRQAEIEDYEISGPYDGVVLWDVLFHIPRAVHRSVLEKIFHSLKPGGMLILSSGGSEDGLQPFIDFMFGVPFFYDAYPVKKLLALCHDIGFTTASYEMLNKPDGGCDKGRIGLVLSKSPQ